MTTNSPDIRYSEAMHEDQRQERIMQQVMKLPDSETKWDSEEVEQKMLALLKTN